MPKVKHGSRQQVLLRLHLGDKLVNVMGMLGMGANAAVFSCSFAGSKQNLAVKIERQVRTGELSQGIYASVVNI